MFLAMDTWVELYDAGRIPLTEFVNRKKARRTGIFSYSPHSADLSFIVTIICGLL